MVIKISFKEVVSLVKDNDVLVILGFVLLGVLELLIKSLEKKFLEEDSLWNLILMFVVVLGDRENKGLNYLVYEGLVFKIIGGYLGLVFKLGILIRYNKIYVYNLF